ncbi:MAG: glycosyltransferase [bacterium]
MNVALVHDWLTGMRGGEKVLEVLCEIFPEATIYTLLCNKSNLSDSLRKMKIKTSFIQNLPFANSRYRNYLPLFPMAIESFILKDYDLVISTSHCVAKGIIPGPATCHICYCLTPMRYIWDMYLDYFDNKKFFKKLITPLITYLRIWDITSSTRVDYYIAISQHVSKRIKKYYRRDSIVIYPPVDTKLFLNSSSSSIPDNKHRTTDSKKQIFANNDYYLVISALVPYKRIDLAVNAFNKLKKRLLVAGDGPELKKIKRIAEKNIEFLGNPDTSVIKGLYHNCKALIFPGEEDFGIVPLEAQAAGKPVIAYGRGGATETILDGQTGVFFKQQIVDALIEAVEKFEKLTFDPEKIKDWAQKFDRKIFKERLDNFIRDKIVFSSNFKGKDKN